MTKQAAVLCNLRPVARQSDADHNAEGAGMRSDIVPGASSPTMNFPTTRESFAR